MAASKDITSQRFGRLVALHRDSDTSRWICLCDCGTTKSIRRTHLTSGKIRSCGCLHDTHAITHGMCYSAEHGAWAAAKARCFNPNNPGFDNYGGRGITMSDEWRDSFEAFYRDMGPSNGLTLDRIDVNGNYERGNCRWITQAEQTRNQRKSVKITHDGLTMNLREWSRYLGIPYSTLNKRRRRGYPLFSAVNKRLPYKKS